MATGMYSWSQTAASNSTADTAINWAEGQLPSTVNDSARGMMSVLAKWRDDISGVQPSNVVQTSGGAANVQTLTTNGSIAALTNGWTLTFKAGFSNTAACTMNVDTLGAKSINRISGTALGGGEIVAGCVYTITYHQPADVWIMHSAAKEDFASGTGLFFYQASAPTGWTAVAQNDKALRVVSAGGTGGTAGGTTAFSSVFASRTIAQANLPNVNFSHSLTAATHTHDSGTYAVSTSINNGTSVARNFDTNTSSNAQSGGGSNIVNTASWDSNTLSLNSGDVSGSSGASGALTVSGTVSSGGTATGMDFAVQYLDVILATKD
jgi:hypothetical protein